VYEQIASNKRKTVLLIFGAIVLLGAVGYALGLWAGSGPAGLIGAVALAIVLSLASFFGGDRLVLASTRAREVTPQDQARLHNIVEGLSIAAGIPKPRVYVIPEQAPNAFATGRNPEHASVAVT
jgi:heat shock protein HtpX